MRRRTVWIVQHDESPDNTVVGVFQTEDEASAFAAEEAANFRDGLIYSEYEIGYRYDKGTRYSRYGRGDG